MLTSLYEYSQLKNKTTDVKHKLHIGLWDQEEGMYNYSNPRALQSSSMCDKRLSVS